MGVHDHVVPAKLSAHLNLEVQRNVGFAPDPQLRFVVGNALAGVAFDARVKRLAGSPIDVGSKRAEVTKANVLEHLVEAVAVKEAAPQVAAPLNPTPCEVVVLAQIAIKVPELRRLLIQPPGLDPLFIGEAVVARPELVAHPVVLRLKTHLGPKGGALAHQVGTERPVLGLAHEAAIHRYALVALSIEGCSAPFEVLAPGNPRSVGFAGVAEGHLSLKSERVAKP